MAIVETDDQAVLPKLRESILKQYCLNAAKEIVRTSSF